MEKTITKTILLLVAFISVGCGQKDNLTYEEGLDALRVEALGYEPSLMTKEGLDLIIALRELTHKIVDFQKTTSPDYSFDRPLENFQRLLNDPEWDHFCGGASLTYVDLLRSFGFQARGIQMITEYGETHVTSEVFFEGRWMAQDPTFNVSFMNAEGSYLNYEMMQSLDSSEIEFIFDGSLYNRDVREYPVPYFDLLHEVYEQVRL